VLGFVVDYFGHRGVFQVPYLGLFGGGFYGVEVWVVLLIFYTVIGGVPNRSGEAGDSNVRCCGRIVVPDGLAIVVCLLDAEGL
jgi:hypothetical protein